MRRVIVFLAAALMSAGCSLGAAVGPPRASSSLLPAPSSTTVPVDVHGLLAQLRVDDHPHSDAGYRRDEWPHWLDLDGDGCDARETALKESSTVPATVNPSTCTVTAGHWVSDYDEKETDNARELDIDHVVPLAEAYRSGGWAWETTQRAQYANDRDNLWAVSASSNRAKGDKTPDQWRPRREAWCTYGQRYANVKIKYQLTVMTSERDAIGQMLEACGG